MTTPSTPPPPATTTLGLFKSFQKLLNSEIHASDRISCEMSDRATVHVQSKLSWHSRLRIGEIRRAICQTVKGAWNHTG